MPSLVLRLGYATGVRVATLAVVSLRCGRYGWIYSPAVELRTFAVDSAYGSHGSCGVMAALLPRRFPCPEDRYWIDDLLNAILLKPAACALGLAPMLGVAGRLSVESSLPPI